MAAANASPVYHGRTAGRDHMPHNPPSAVNGSGAQHGGHQRHGTVTGTVNGFVHSAGHAPLHDPTTGYNIVSDDHMYLPDSHGYNAPFGQTGLGNGHREHPTNRPSHSAEAIMHKVTEAPSTGDNYEIQHLRTQLKSVGVLQELLADQRSELHTQQEIIEEFVKTHQQARLSLSLSLQEKLSRLRIGSSSFSLPDSEWSVELKRPPQSMVPSQTNANDQFAELIKLQDDQIKSLREEIGKLYYLLQSSEDEKSREIGRLKEQLRDQSQDCQTSEAICQSLNGETEVLRTKIHNLAQECQGLSAELDRWKKKKLTEKAIPASMPDTPVSVESQFKIAKQQVIQLDREKGQLGDQLKEVIRMNKRWQKYCRQQDASRDELTQAKEDADNENKVLELRCKDYDDLMKKIQRDLRENESRHRHQQSDHRDDVIRRLQLEVAQLGQDLRKEKAESSKFDKEMVKQQLKQYSEDFQKEHLEKEKLKRENIILTRNHLEAEELVRQLSRELETAEREKRGLKLQERDLRRNAAYMQRERRELTPHGMGLSSPDLSFNNYPTLPQEVVRDGPGQAHSAPGSVSPAHSPISPPMSPPLSNTAVGEDFVDLGKEGQSSCGEDEPLQCPRCLREFPVSKHSDFMRHTEQCLDT